MLLGDAAALAARPCPWRSAAFGLPAVAGAFEGRRGRGRVIGRRRREPWQASPSQGGRWARRRREAAVGAGVIDVDQARVLGQEARSGGEEDVVAALGWRRGIRSRCGLSPEEIRLRQPPELGDVELGAFFFAVFRCRGRLPLIDVLRLPLVSRGKQRVEAVEEEARAVVGERSGAW